MARAQTPTLLSLDRYAYLMGIPPVHFNGAFATTVWPLTDACREVWPQYAWQKYHNASREDLAQAIADAETDIARQLGYWPAPQWISAERYLWPRPGYKPYNTIKTKWGKVIRAGRRATSLIESGAAVTFSDEDDDDWKEVATITANTSVTDPKEIKIYFAGHSGARDWEIRPVRSITISSGVVTIKADSWLFIDPALWEAYPTSQFFLGLDIEDTTKFVDEVDIYREYAVAETSVEHLWLNPEADNDCVTQTADGCFLTIEPDNGWIRPDYPNESIYLNGNPSGGSLWYLAGDQSERYLSGESLDPLSDYWAQTIVYLATARLELTPSSCGTGLLYFEQYRTDLVYQGNNRARYLVTLETMSNPFGTRFGEVKAWERVYKASKEAQLGGGVI